MPSFQSTKIHHFLAAEVLSHKLIEVVRDFSFVRNGQTSTENGVPVQNSTGKCKIEFNYVGSFSECGDAIRPSQHESFQFAKATEHRIS